ncbi:MAG: MotB family protein [Neorhizobium sp.]|nr:MotB family protein [Neorhizobium sp.]
MKDGENHHHGKNEIIIVRRHKGDHDGHHGGAWKIAYADFMTAMMAFFLVMWLVNAANEETKASLASFFNPVELSDDTPAEKGLKKPADQMQGEHDKPKSEQQSDKDGGGVGGQDQTKPAMSGDDTSYSEADLFKNPYAVLTNIAQEVGQQANVSTKGEGGASDSGPSTGADGGQAYRDPFDPDFWSKQVQQQAKAGVPSKDSSLPGQEGSAFSNPPAADAKTDAKAQAAANAAGAKQDGQQQVAALTAKDGQAAAAQASAKESKAAKTDGQPAKAASTQDKPSEGTPAEQKQAKALQAELQGAVSGVGGKLAEGLEVTPSEGGMLISISDQSNEAMFNVGSAVPNRDMVLAMEKIGKILAEKTGSVVIRGHTDGRAYKGAEGDNWSLSMSRAHAAYYMLVRGGLTENRIEQVSGFADRRLQVPNNPMADANRRIEILLGGKG